MNEPLDDQRVENLSHERFLELLERLSQRGLTQQQVASRVAIPPQYLSDIKAGRRPMTELVARRLADAFEVHHAWLLGLADTMAVSPVATSPSTGGAWLPLFPHPIEGEPRMHPDWEGIGVEVSGVAAGRLALATHPYVLRFGHDDIHRRLRKGDFVLISQSPADGAEISVVRHRKKLFLARRGREGIWERVANGHHLPQNSPAAGHCLGIIWSSLLGAGHVPAN